LFFKKFKGLLVMSTSCFRTLSVAVNISQTNSGEGASFLAAQFSTDGLRLSQVFFGLIPLSLLQVDIPYLEAGVGDALFIVGGAKAPRKITARLFRLFVSR
jgi:hypothetical protein